MFDIRKAVEHIASHWGVDMFLSGDCHTLAMALHQAHAQAGADDGRTGTLWACLRKAVDESGQVVTTTYSHMVYVAPNGAAWDIEGVDADERWDEQFSTQTRDKWGLIMVLDWIQVPCACPDYSDTHVWLLAHFATVTPALQLQLAQHLRGLGTELLRN